MSGWGGNSSGSAGSRPHLAPEELWKRAGTEVWAVDYGIFAVRAAEVRGAYPDCEATAIDVFKTVRRICLSEFSRHPTEPARATQFVESVLAAPRLLLVAAAHSEAGSPQAWTRIAELLQDTVARMPLREADRLDVVSESFLIVRERALATYDVTRSLRAFLHGVARNVGRRIRSFQPPIPLPEQWPANTPEPLDELWIRERSRMLSLAMNTLGERDQRLLNKRVVEGKRLREIASEEGLKNPQEAHRRYHSARQTLRRAIFSLIDEGMGPGQTADLL